MKENEGYIGHFKYSGKSVEDGLLDARKAGNALIGFDKILRHFLSTESPELAKVEFPLPVKIEKGSWKIVLGSLFLVYLFAIVTKAGKDGFLETGPAKDIAKVLRFCMTAACWAVNIRKHVGKTGKFKFEDLDASFTESGEFAILLNHKGEKKLIPIKYYELCKTCPEDLFSQNTEIIDDGGTMDIESLDSHGETHKASINDKERFMFAYDKSDQLAEVLPELKHGRIMTLEGEITRVNEEKNAIGFLYQKIHIECKPEGGYIAQFKDSIISKKTGDIFENVRMEGRIERIDDDGKQKKISIKIITINPIRDRFLFSNLKE